MVGTFVRLKLRLLRNRLRRSGPIAILAFVAVWFGASALGAVGGFIAYFASRIAPGVLALIWVFIALGWIVVPLIASALDDTVEPSRLQLLPIPNISLALGLLAAGAVGPGALATSLVVIGGVASFARSGPALIGQIVAGIVMVIWCLISARIVTTVLSDAVRSRRGRDLVAVVGPLLGLLGLAFSQGLQSISIGRAQGGARFLEYFWIFPPGALARAVEEFGARGLIPLLLLGYGVIASAVVLWLWGLALQRLVTRTPANPAVNRIRGSFFHRGLPSRLADLGITSPQAAAVASKELRGMRRDPRLRSQFIGLGIAVLVLTTGIGRRLMGTEFAPLIAVAGAFIGVNAIGFNLLGMDNGSIWAYLASGVSWRSVLVGKNLAILFLAGSVTTALATIGFIAGGTILTFLIALLGGASVALIWISVGNNVSVLGAFAMPDSNLFGTRNLPGGVFLPSILGLMIASALTAPIAGLVAFPWLWRGPGYALAGAVLALFLSVGVYRLSLSMAVGQIESRTPRLLEVLDGR